MKGSVGLAAIAWCAIVIACAANPSANKGAVAPTSAAQAPRSPQDDQINQLAAEIDRERAEMGLAEPAVSPACANGACGGSSLAIPMNEPVTPSSADKTCHPAPTDACKQSCTLSDSICVNSKKICEIAQQLTGDTWATQKCSESSATCKAAHDRCCACLP